MRTSFAVGTAVVLCAGAAAQAQLSFSFDEAMFAANSNAMDDYAPYATPGGPDLPIPVADGPTTLGAFTYTALGSEAGLGELEIRSASSSEPASENSLFAFLDGDPDNFSFTIQAVGGPMNAIGFDFLSASSLGGTIISFDNGESFAVGDQLPSPGTGFLGVTSVTPFTTVSFKVQDQTSFEGMFIETLYADVVPAPTGALAMTGLMALGLRRRR